MVVPLAPLVGTEPFTRRELAATTLVIVAVVMTTVFAPETNVVRTADDMKCLYGKPLFIIFVSLLACVACRAGDCAVGYRCSDAGASLSPSSDASGSVEEQSARVAASTMPHSPIEPSASSATGNPQAAGEGEAPCAAGSGLSLGMRGAPTEADAPRRFARAAASPAHGAE